MRDTTEKSSNHMRLARDDTIDMSSVTKPMEETLVEPMDVRVSTDDTVTAENVFIVDDPKSIKGSGEGNSNSNVKKVVLTPKTS